MCIAAILTGLAAAAPVAGAAATIYGATQGRGARKDAASAQANADAMATQTANARLAQRRRALSANSLITDQGTSGVANAGRVTLGGG